MTCVSQDGNRRTPVRKDNQKGDNNKTSSINNKNKHTTKSGAMKKMSECRFHSKRHFTKKHIKFMIIKQKLKRNDEMGAFDIPTI